MNILVIGKFTADQFGFHIVDTLQDMGHNVVSYDPSLPYKYADNILTRRIYQIKNILYNNLLMTPSFRSIKRKKLYDILSNNKIDLTICTHDFLQPDEVDKIKTMSNAPIALWFPDSVSGFNRAFFMISDYDFLFFKDPYIVKVLTENYNKKNVYYLPECCNPKFHKNVELNSDDLKMYGCDITTYGSPHNARTSFFYQLTKYDYKIKIWGHQPAVWLRDEKLRALYTSKYVFNDTKAKSVLGAKININTLHPSEITGLNARTFEIAGIGGFQLVHWRERLKDFFIDDEEIVSFKNFDELLEKIIYYIDKPDARNKIAVAGQKRTVIEHTYEKRLKKIIEKI